MRSYLLIIIAVAMLALAGCGGGKELAGTTGLQVTVSSSAAADSEGGPVTITAEISSSAPPQLVGAKVTVPSGAEEQFLLTPVSSRPNYDASQQQIGVTVTYRGVYNVPANTDPNSVMECAVVVEAHDAVGSVAYGESKIYIPTPWTKEASGLEYRILEPGTGAPVQNGDEVEMYYEGRLGTGELFQCNFPDHEDYWDHQADLFVTGPFSFTLGSGQVIQGWEQGVPGMKVGERRQLVIPPELGYGDQERTNIPANSTLRFTIEMVSINK